jgi:hypothetical protein
MAKRRSSPLGSSVQEDTENGADVFAATVQVSNSDGRRTVFIDGCANSIGLELDPIVLMPLPAALMLKFSDAAARDSLDRVCSTVPLSRADCGGTARSGRWELFGPFGILSASGALQPP